MFYSIDWTVCARLLLINLPNHLDKAKCACNEADTIPKGPVWKSNPAPLAPEARIMPLDQQAT